MRNVFLLLVLTVCCLTVSATEVNDTIIMANAKDTTVINNNDKVVIVTGDEPYKVKVIRKENDDECKVHDFSAHFSIGVNMGLGTPEGMSIKPFKSWDIALTVFQYDYSPKKKLQTYSAGVGIGWHNYGIGSSKMFTKDANGVVGLTDYPANAGSKYSRINIFNIFVPLLFTQKFDSKGKYSLSVGPVVNFNVAGHLTAGYETNDIEYDLTTRKIDYRPVTVDIMGVFNINDIGIYARYSPMTVMKKNRGPEFRSLTLGLYF